jgi:hypothetical protein
LSLLADISSRSQVMASFSAQGQNVEDLRENWKLSTQNLTPLRAEVSRFIVSVQDNMGL